jgi:hypothetical protein
MTSSKRILTPAIAGLLGWLASATPAAAASEPPPAGGGSTGQVVLGTIGAALATAAMLFVVAGHRSGRLKAVGRLAAFSERVSGLPGWAALPLAVGGGSLLIAVFGMYWDISIHLDQGRDPGPFANAAHYFILVGLFGILFSGMLAIALPLERPGQSAVQLAPGWQAPLGGVLIFACAAFALSGFPLDDVWHRLFGQDVTLWGPTHLMLFGGAALSTLGTWILFAEGLRAADRTGAKPSNRFRLLSEAALAGAFLIALSTFQGEFDFSVPQFRLDFHPILLMLAASIALVAARLRIGRGGALLAVVFFLIVRGTLSLFVGPLFGHTTLHFPLYLAEAGVVELAGLLVPRDRPLRFGAVAGAAIGTVGLAAEWAWSHVWWVLPWPSSMLPEAAVAAFAAAVGGGVLGGFVGSSLASPVLGRFARPRLAVPAAAVAVLAAVVWATPISDGRSVRAELTTREAAPAPQRAVDVTVKLDPPGAADGARWLTITAWQGGGSVVDRLERTGPGTYRTTRPIPVYGNWKSTLRLHRGSAVQGLPLFMPRDSAIPAREIPVEPRVTRSFVDDKQLLQREQKDVSGVLTLFAYLSVLAIGLGLVASLALGLRRLERSSRTAVTAGDTT